MKVVATDEAAVVYSVLTAPSETAMGSCVSGVDRGWLATPFSTSAAHVSEVLVSGPQQARYTELSLADVPFLTAVHDRVSDRGGSGFGHT